MKHLSYKPGSVGVVFDGLPPNCTEAEAADMIWFNTPGGLNVPIEQLSCKTQASRDGSTVIAVLSPAVIHDFLQRILEQGKSKLKVHPHTGRIQCWYVLFSAWGRQHWWPARSRFEVIVGAYLTQNTSWTNVEKALANLRRAGRLTIGGVRRTPQTQLEQWIRPAGYFRQKAQRLKTFVRFLDTRHGGSLARMFARPTAELRDELLALNGVGPETADSILLYSGNHPVFVVDAYTRRILERHEIVSSAAAYDEIRLLFEQALGGTRLSGPPKQSLDGAPSKTSVGPRGSSHPPSAMSEAARPPLVQAFNEMHGLMVGVGKTYCLKSQPRCEQCPLQKFLARAK